MAILHSLYTGGCIQTIRCADSVCVGACNVIKYGPQLLYSSCKFEEVFFFWCSQYAQLSNGYWVLDIGSHIHTVVM